MDAETLLSDLRDSGLWVALSGDGLVVTPGTSLTDGQRAEVKATRAALLTLLRCEAAVKASLVAAIDRCCDARGDDDNNRLVLIEECQCLPLAGQIDMTEHFEQEAARFTPKGADTEAGRPTEGAG